MQAQRVEVDGGERALPVRIEAADVRASIPDVELESPLLPRDHPPWMRDGVALSAHAKRLLERMCPVIIRVLGFWDHAIRSVQIAGRRIDIDAAGCYRMN